jgi:hypothetical protein
VTAAIGKSRWADTTSRSAASSAPGGRKLVTDGIRGLREKSNCRADYGGRAERPCAPQSACHRTDLWYGRRWPRRTAEVITKPQGPCRFPVTPGNRRVVGRLPEFLVTASIRRLLSVPARQRWCVERRRSSAFQVPSANRVGLPEEPCGPAVRPLNCSAVARVVSGNEREPCPVQAGWEGATRVALKRPGLSLVHWCTIFLWQS